MVKNIEDASLLVGIHLFSFIENNQMLFKSMYLEICQQLIQ